MGLLGVELAVNKKRHAHVCDRSVVLMTALEAQQWELNYSHLLL